MTDHFDRSTVDNSQIRALCAEAAQHGDSAMAADCDAALGGDSAAVERCIDAIQSAFAAAGKVHGTIHEEGNGLAGVGDYVSCADGNVYRVTRLLHGGRISTNGPGAGNSVDAELELADWDDISEDDEPTCSVPRRFSSWGLGVLEVPIWLNCTSPGNQAYEKYVRRATPAAC